MFFRRAIIVLLNLFVFVSKSNSARILSLFFVNSRSHHSINQPILKTLAARGHEVTVLSYFKSKETLANYTELLLDEGPSFVDSLSIDQARQFSGFINYIFSVMQVEKNACAQVLRHEYIRNLINSDVKEVDFLFVEQYHSLCYNLIAHKLNVPIIAIIPPYTTLGVDIMIGNPSLPSYLPLITTSYTTNMNFWQRFVNSVQCAIIYVMHYTYFNNHLKEIARDHFHMEAPSFESLQRKVALALYNNHFSFIPRPLVSNAINIAGIHIAERKPLPKDIQKFIDDSNHGVIFFSFGSTIKGSSIHPEKLQIIKKVFSSIPQRILWRIDDLNMTGLSSNIKLGKWFPQRDILEHKNVRAFISHCGLLGTLEAIYTSTPVIALPFMFDQFQDGKVLEEHGAAIYIDYHSLTENIFREAINKIIKDEKYYENMSKLSKIFKDRPMAALDEAIYWTEYVMKYNGAPHLRSRSADMPFYQYFLLDVIFFVMTIVFFVLFITKYFIKKIKSLVLFNDNNGSNKYKAQ